MSIKSLLAIPFAKQVKKQVYKWAYKPHETQKRIFNYLITQGRKTAFGKDCNFALIKNYDDFKKRVPVNDYEGLKKYIERIIKGEEDVLWKGKPLYFAKTSGTTSGVKYIPISKESMPTHIKAARNALMCYIAEKNNASFVKGKMIFLQGSPRLDNKNGIKLGRLSGIVAHYVPNYLLKNRLPSLQTNCIANWETKLNKIVEETLPENMTLISGIPSWVQMYFEKLIEKTGKRNISEIFPNFKLFVYGGVNFEPYNNKFKTLIGSNIDSIELYPASEGFIAYQDSQNTNGMLLQLNSGIFYEFIKAEDFFDKTPKRIALNEVKLGVNYVIILNTSAGLWGYNIGDTIEFTCLKPYRIRVTGRIEHFISAFGEHVIAKEVEQALNKAITGTNISVSEFTVAPQVNPTMGLPYHEWFIEFENEPENTEAMALKMDAYLQEQNSYYRDLIKGKILKPLIIKRVKKGGFYQYMKSIGKLGGQNKIPKLSDNRNIAEALQNYVVK
ncbi:MAG: GH3 auxin-responsive promoter family protein [Tenacibaculum sp.]